MAPAAVSSVRNMQEILFAQRLSDNDKKIRDRAVKKLRKYLAVKSSNGPGFTEDDMIKIWKGLFYCMYMADKPLVQEDLSENISGLISELGNNADRRCFFKAAMATFAREWHGLDVFRYDKFMMLVRKVLRYTFTHLLEQEWALEEVTAIATILENIVICPDDNLNRQPMGLKLHVTDIFLEELAKIGGEKIKNDVIIALLQPFFKVLAISTLETLVKKVSNDIIRYLMRQSDLGIEAEEEQEMESEEEEQENEEQEDKEGTEEMETEDGEEDNNELLTESENAENDDLEEEGTLLENGLTIASTGPLDPRAGGVDVCLPQLKLDWGALADALQSLGSIGGVKQKNRENLYKLVGELQDLSAGMYPLDVPEDDEDDDCEVPQEEMEKALDRLQYREEKLAQKILKGKKWKKNKGKTNEEVEDDEESLKPFISESMKVEKKRKKRKSKKNFKPDAHTGVKKHKPNTGEEETQLKEEVSARLKTMIPEVEMESTEFKEVANVVVEMTKKKKNRKRKKFNGFVVTNIEEKVITDKECSMENIVISDENTTDKLLDTEMKPKKKKKKNDMNISETNEVVEDRPKKVKKNKNKILNDTNKDEEVDSESSTKEKKKKKKKKKKSSIEATEIPEISSTSEQNIEKKKKKKKKIITETLSNEFSTTNVQETTLNSSPSSLVEKIKKKKLDFNIGSETILEVQPLAISNKVNKTRPNKDLVLNFAVSKNKQLDPWDEPLKEGETEVFIKSKKQIAKEKRKKKKVISSAVVKSSTGNKRAIKINLKANQEHTVKEYHRDVKNTPALPIPLPAFPASPGILKPSPSPILVRKKSLKIRDKLSILSSASPQLKKSNKSRMRASDFFT